MFHQLPCTIIATHILCVILYTIRFSPQLDSKRSSAEFIKPGGVLLSAQFVPSHVRRTMFLAAELSARMIKTTYATHLYDNSEHLYQTQLWEKSPHPI